MTANSEDSEQKVRLVDREINEVVVRALRAKRTYQKHASGGEVPGKVTRTVRDAAIDLFNTLRWWRDKDQIHEQWEDGNLDTFGELLRQRSRRPGSRNSRLSRPASQVTQLRIAELSPGQLVQFIDSMLDIARDLGFAPHVDEPTTQTEITDEMVEEVEEWRQQNLE